MRKGTSDASPANAEEFQLLLHAAVALPDAGIGKAKSDIVVLVGRRRAIGLSDILVHRPGAHGTSVEVLLLRSCDEVVDCGAAALDLKAAFPTLGQLSAHVS